MFNSGPVNRILLFDIAMLVMMLFGFVQLREKAGIAEWNSGEPPTVSAPLATQSPALIRGDVVIAINGIPATTIRTIDVICDRGAIGDTVSVGIVRGGSRLTVRQELGGFYSVTYFAICILSAFVFFALAIAVIVRRPKDEPSRVFHHIMIASAMMVLMSPGRYEISPVPIGLVVRILHGWAHVFQAASLAYFPFVFPRRSWSRTTTLKRLLYSIASIIGVVYMITFFNVFLADSAVSIARFVSATEIMQWFTIIGMFAAIIRFGYAYHLSSMDIRRTKLRWVLAGFLIGPTAVALLYYLPQSLWGTPIISEDTLLLVAAGSAVLFAIAIVRNRVLDIEFLVTRGTVYGLVLTALAAIYAVVAGGLTAAIGANTTSSQIPAIAAAAFVVLLFAPVQSVVRRFVDTRFYRVRYNFRVAQRELVDTISRCVEITPLAHILISGIDSLIPVERAAVFSMTPSGTHLQLKAQKGCDETLAHVDAVTANVFGDTFGVALAIDGSVEVGVEIAPAPKEVFSQWGFVVGFPLRSEDNTLIGMFALGKKKSGARFTMEDIDLLHAAVAQTGLTMDRIHLQGQLLVERAESQRLEELSAMKSYFVSSVSHELKTPLTSIRLYAELLESKDDLPRETEREYLSIIEGESARLTRLINNVLDFAKIERGTKSYTIAPVAINDVVRHVLKTMAYQFTMNRFTVETTYDEHIVTVNADADAVAEAVINLLSNAIKYSPREKHIRVETKCGENTVSITVRDRGIGIAQIEQQKIFEPFYRSTDGYTPRAGGAGLGLALVRHIMEAHSGEVVVDSALGIGSAVSLIFPTASEASEGSVGSAGSL